MELEKVYGGYFGLETQNNTEYWDNAVALNTGRNCLRQVIRYYGVKKLFAPKYTCPCVWEAINAEDCELVLYSIDSNMMPLGDISADEYVLYTNYLGVCSENVEKMTQKYPRLIVDCSQSFFSAKKGIATFNSARKFFGVSDGAYLMSDKALDNSALERDVSYGRTAYLMKRIELGSQAGFMDFHENEEKLCNEEIKTMSALTRHILSGVDYESIKRVRRSNWAVLDSMLGEINEWSGRIDPEDVPMAYPFIYKSDSLRHRLIENKIFVPTFWKGQKDTEYGSYFEQYLFPLPMDQRYDENDMRFIADFIKKTI